MPDGRAPSDAFAPQSQMKSTGAENVQSTEAQYSEPETLVGRIRLVEQDFEAQGQGELGLVQGERVRVTHDPEGESGGGADRWVYGSNVVTEETGWFPLSHTVFLDEVATEEEAGPAEPEPETPQQVQS